MKRILILIAFLLSAWIASAQSELHVGAIFDGKVVSPNAMKETFIRSSQLDFYNLELYHSVSFTGNEQVLAEVSRLVLADAENATEQEIHMNGGKLVYAILTFERTNHENWFICYQCVSKAGSYAITLVYLQGPATLDNLKILFKTKAK